LTEQQRKFVLAKLLNNVNQKGELLMEIDRLLQVCNAPLTAVRLLECFGQTFTRQSHVTRVLASQEFVNSGNVFPQTKNFVDLSERQTNNLACVMSELALKIANCCFQTTRRPTMVSQVSEKPCPTICCS
jgi:hypothetical protein